MKNVGYDMANFVFFALDNNAALSATRKGLLATVWDMRRGGVRSEWFHTLDEVEMFFEEYRSPIVGARRDAAIKKSKTIRALLGDWIRPVTYVFDMGFGALLYEGQELTLTEYPSADAARVALALADPAPFWTEEGEIP